MAVTVLIAGYDLLRVSVLVVDDIASAVPLRVSGTVKHIIPLIHLYGGSGIVIYRSSFRIVRVYRVNGSHIAAEIERIAV